ncbi:hypothetical protein CHS0354_001958 [Potamilus streckersoni]|uniref:FAD linked oxidase N-terminal domain-containing protein n=1 Tax=Potamilus streckersoni TaxID=2493646 RepID=A0AAE0T5U0_9BIVA|nr:hypothetical protein CHS0354_001958 [Potamilus streckersoni]
MMPRLFSEADLENFRRIKSAFNPKDILNPDKECAERIKDALQTKTTVAVIGKGTRSGIADAVKISASRMTDVAFFHPEDMVIGVKAGMEVGTLKKLLAEAKMELEIDAHRDDTTIGSAVAMNDTGASRLFGGGVRDKIIGIEYIDGFGDIVKGGGKVVKNVAGYDTPK